jgi:hypothetical protein
MVTRQAILAMPRTRRGWRSSARPGTLPRDLRRSRRFRHERPAEKFVYLDLGGAELMVEQETDLGPAAPRERPYGRGLSLSCPVVCSCSTRSIAMIAMSAGFIVTSFFEVTHALLVHDGLDDLEPSYRRCA